MTRCGRIGLGSRKINLSVALAEQLVGDPRGRRPGLAVSFLQYDLGQFDRDQDRVEPGPNAFAPDTVSITRPERGVNHVTGIHHHAAVRRGIRRRDRGRARSVPVVGPDRGTVNGHRQRTQLAPGLGIEN